MSDEQKTVNDPESDPKRLRMLSLLQEYRALLSEAARQELERTDWIAHQFRFAIAKAGFLLAEEPVFGLQETTARALELIALREDAKDAVAALSELQDRLRAGLDVQLVADQLRHLEELSEKYIRIVDGAEAGDGDFGRFDYRLLALPQF